MNSESMSHYAIYDTTKDFPGEYVCRRFEILPGRAIPRELVGRSKTLEGIRELVPPGYVRLQRSPQDDPVILETWI